MKTLHNFLLLSLALFFLQPTLAQEIPKPSPHAKVKQRVGLTDITIDYYSPGVKGRKIFGKLVPYGEMWRTGANAATTIEFSKPVLIKGEKVPAGKYSFFTIPKKKKWTLILNKKTEMWGTSNYKKEHDQLRFKVEPKDLSKKRERMTFLISDFDKKQARIDLEWAQTRVSFSIETKTDKHTMANIEKTLSEVPGQYASSARYALRAEKHYEKALEWANMSIDLEPSWFNTWVKGELLMRLDRHEKAYKAMKRSKKLGNKAESFYYKDKVKKQLKKLKKKVEG
ncbi:MAG: DUF2911 domain-containing protein [Flavobacteriales bacterium]